MRHMMMAVAAGVLAAGVVQPAAAAAPVLFTDSRVVVQPRFSVEIVGSGPDLVLIPGLASSRETWRTTAERLRRTYRLHLVQVAGFAGEPARANATGPVFTPLVADLDAYLASLRYPIVIGHSLGGTLGLALAERSPAHMAKLLIVDSLPFYGVMVGGPTATADSVAPIANAMRASTTPLPEAQLKGMMAMMATAPADVEKITAWSRASEPSVVGRAMGDDVATDLRPDLAKVSVPVTVLYETVLEPAIAAGYAPLTTKTLIPVPNARHFIMFDQPARFDAEVDAFLKR